MKKAIKIARLFMLGVILMNGLRKLFLKLIQKRQRL